MKTFKVTFTENKKYNPVTRTLKVKAEDEFHAKVIISNEHGSMTFDKKVQMYIPSDKKIKITKVKEIKKEKKG